MLSPHPTSMRSRSHSSPAPASTRSLVSRGLHSNDAILRTAASSMSPVARAEAITSSSSLASSQSQGSISPLEGPKYTSGSAISSASDTPSPSTRKKIFRLPKRPSTSSGTIEHRGDPHPFFESLPHAFETIRPSTSSGPPKRPSTSSGVMENSGGLRLRRRSSPETTTRGVSSGPGSALHPSSFGPVLKHHSTSPPLRQSRSSKAKSPPSATILSVEEEGPELQFSTSDRIIFQELRSKLLAQQSHFVLKNGSRCHPYRTNEVPYPRSYEQIVLDHDVWECMWLHQACSSVTWHVFKWPPAKVLDIGCGTGSWILDCAKQWPESHFVGLDVVPLQIDLHSVGQSDLASRVSWIKANLLDKLPFPNEEFDFVHVKRIARGVPEDKWDALLEEIARVMKPGAAFEMFEEELVFLGNPPEKQDSNESGDRPAKPSGTTPPGLSKASPPISHTPVSPLSSFSRVSSPKAQARPLDSDRPPSLYLGNTVGFSGSMINVSMTLPIAPPPLSAKTSDRHLWSVTTPLNIPHPKELALGDAELLKTPTDVKMMYDPRDHSLLEYIYTETHASRFINLEPLALLANSLPLFFKDVRSHPPLIASFPPRPSQQRQTYPHSSLTINPTHSPAKRLSGLRGDHRGVLSDILETNNLMAPVSLMGLIEGANPYVRFDTSRYDAFSPSSHSIHLPSRSRASSTSEHPHALGTSGTTLEYLPDTGTSHSHIRHDHAGGYESSHEKVDMLYRLPNVNMTFDPKSLNLHLALRVHDILACGEAMWEFVLQYQDEHNATINSPSVPHGSKLEDVQRRRANSKSQRLSVYHEALMKLTRTEFQRHLTNFELDMKDQCYLDSTMQDKLGWAQVPRSQSAQREEFDRMCRDWTQFLEKRQGQTISPNMTSAIPLPSSGIGAHHSQTGVNTGLKSGGTTTSTPVDHLSSRSKSDECADPANRISRVFRVFVAWKA